MAENLPLVSLVILNWNGKKFLDMCLSSVFQQSYKNYEVIVVDNASTDSSPTFVSTEYPQVQLIINKENVGCPKGYNIGIEACHGKYAAFLNNDVKLEPHWIEEMVKIIEGDEKVGICASKLLFMDNPKVIDSMGGNKLTKEIVPMNLLCRGLLDSREHNNLREIFYADGAIFSRKEALIKVGLFDSGYFGYWEDGDLCWRMHLLGYKCVSVPKARAYHKRGASFKDNSYFKFYLDNRNRWYTIIKNLSLSSMLIYLPYLFVHEIKWFWFSIRCHSLAPLKARVDVLKALPVLFKKRRKIQSSRVVSPKEFRHQWLK